MSEQQLEANVISDAKEKLSEVIPTPPAPAPQASAQSLQERLKWGEPGLTIIDARDRDSFLTERITGAMLMEDMNELAPNREIYIYSSSDAETAAAADQLRQSGFSSVSQIQGGLAGWKAVQGATEGRAV